jgi:DNA (cytosine-5)-methyltransferase 1
LVGDSNKNSKPRLQVNDEMAVNASAFNLGWWKDDTKALGISDGMAHRMDRLAALGNGQVSIVAATAFTALARRLGV